MPSRAVIPSRALRDVRLSATDLRVLLAMGSHADWSGRNIWASSATMMAEARVTRTSFFRAVRRLTATGYVTGTPRYGPDRRQLTTMYAILHDTPTAEDLPPAPPPATDEDLLAVPRPVLVPDFSVEPDEGEGAKPVARGSAKAVAREGAKALAPKQPKELSPKTKTPRAKKVAAPKKPSPNLPTPGEAETLARIWRTYPKRVEPPHDFVRARRAIVALLRSGVPAERLEEAAEAYAEECRVGRIGPKYVKAMQNFFDGTWESYEAPVTVDGLTRAEWIRARKDVAEFDRRSGTTAALDIPDDEPLPDDHLDL